MSTHLSNPPPSKRKWAIVAAGLLFISVTVGVGALVIEQIQDASWHR